MTPGKGAVIGIIILAAVGLTLWFVSTTGTDSGQQHRKASDRVTDETAPATASTVVPATASATQHFLDEVEPILFNRCYDCHGDGASKGDFAFDEHESFEHLVDDHSFWLRVWENVRADIMPPPKKDRLTAEERDTLVRWIQSDVFKLGSNPDPGRVTIRRLNRVEYRWTIYDLFGIDFDVELHLPADDSGYGFDNIGDVLSVSPMLMEKYISAARSIVGKLEASSDDADPPLWWAPPVLAADSSPGDQNAGLREFFENFASRLFRRPVDESTLDHLISLVDKAASGAGKTTTDGVHQAMVAVLCSPQFLFRTEPQPQTADADMVVEVDDFALASRLSYFLWKSCPDETLLELAYKGELRGQRKAQIDRLLKDPKSQRFVRDFVGQWLQINDLFTTDINFQKALGLSYADSRKIWTRSLKRALRDETEHFFQNALHANRPVGELLTADYTFLNEELANYYEIDGVQGEQMRKVNLPASSPRGGLLTHASVLTVTSTAGRTSPVKRGIFVLENLLATPAPPVVPNVPALEDAVTDKARADQMSLREKLELHRAKPECASCHARMDPIGFGLENFNAVGKWRTRENGGVPIDGSGTLVSGETFSSGRELAAILANSKQRQFHRAIVEKLLTYALGRGLEYYDYPTVETLVDQMVGGKNGLRDVIYLIADSRPFLYRRSGSTSNDESH